MLKTAIRSLIGASGQLVKNWKALAIILLLYAATLLALDRFLQSGDATMLQFAETAAMVVVAPVLFFILQAACVTYMKAGTKGGRLIGLSLKAFWKLMLISIPFLLLIWLLVYLIGRIPASAASRAPAAAHEIIRAAASHGHSAPAPNKPIDWSALGITALEIVLFALAIPLAIINLWIAAAREGLGQTAKRSARILLQSFAPSGVLTYLMGSIVFGAIPLALLFIRTSSTHPWFELSLEGLRIGAAMILAVVGWAITLGALSQRQAPEQGG